MSLVDILEISGCVIGGLGVALTGTVGVFQGRYNFENAAEFYNDAPDDIKKLIGEPNKLKIYFQSVKDAPKFMFATYKNKQFDDAFMKYVEPIVREKGKDYMRLYVLGQLLKKKQIKL
jgi:hypothetical protein